MIVVTKFESGSRPEIREKVSTLEIKDYTTLVNKYRILERSHLEVEFKRERQNFLKRKREVDAQKKNNFRNGVYLKKIKQMVCY